MHRPDVWLQTTPVILDQRKRLASKGRPCMEDACSRMECAKDAICRGVRRSVRGQSLNQLGSAHKISDSPLSGEMEFFHSSPCSVNITIRLVNQIQIKVVRLQFVDRALNAVFARS